MSGIAFKPIAATVLANVSNVAASVSVTSNTQPAGAWFITNAGTTDVFFRLSTNAAVVAAVPTTTNTSAPGQMINSGDTYIIGLPSADGNGPYQFVTNVAISSMTQTGTSQIFVNPVEFLPGGN